ncbi:MAG: glycerate kinase, partial [Saprospiraceae bacterium]|nr:glycerate kinase [Saprospiraceae bacterium]
LESGMRHFASVLQQFGYPDISQVPGAGAAGGIAGGLHALLGAELISGIQFITEQLDLARHMQDADLVLTGEGFLDDQTLQGKVIRGVVESASINKVPVIALCGGVGLDVASLDELGLTAAYGIQPSCRTIAEGLTHAEDDLFLTTYQVMKTVALS